MTRLFLFPLMTFFAFGCAQLGTPRGGPKDAMPPQTVAIYPPNLSTHFEGKKIEITFDEYLKLNNLKQQLLISPPLLDPPEVTLSGKTITIKWQEPLKANTTYVISFGNSITDITEGNAIPDFKYVFSTGAYLDSLMVSGKVKDAFSKESCDGTLVLMYRLNELEAKKWDSLPSLQLPDYFTRTDSEGNYLITNVRDGRYKIMALDDANANYLYDLPGEAIGFLEEEIIPGDSTEVPTLLRFTPIQEHAFLKARSVKSGQVDFIFTTKADWASVELLEPIFKTDAFYTTTVADDTLRWFFDWGETDSLIFLVSDSRAPSGQSYSNTVVVKPRKNAKRESLTLMHNILGEFLEMNDSLVLTFNIPLMSVNNSLMTLVRNSTDTLHVQSKSSIQRPSIVQVPFEFQYQSTYVLYIAEGAFTDVFGNSFPADSIRFKTRQETDYGSLIMIFEEPQFGSIISLLDEKGAVIRKIIASGEQRMEWKNLTGGDRRIQVVEDDNENKIWDSGNYWKKIHPEKVHYYPEKIQIRPNWEIEIIFNQKPEDEK